MMHSFQIKLRRLCVVLVGAVFYVAGMLKLIDPVGTGLIVTEYLKFMPLGWMMPAAKAIGVVLTLLETLTGAAMLAGLWRRVLSYLVPVLMGFYTLLTLALVIFNPQMDCGCFGEAIHLTHVQSFIKNVVLLALTLVGYIPIRTGVQPRTAKFVVFAIVAALSLGLCIHSLRSVPIVDFTEYSPGAELAGKWDGPQDGDAPILSFTDEYGQYMDSLAVEEGVLAVTVYDPLKLGWKEWSRVSQAVTDALCTGLQPLLLVPCLDGVPTDLVDYVYFSDYKQLITLNRSNGGYTLISDGVVIGKWPNRRPLGMERLDKMARDGHMETYASRTVYGRVTLQAILLLTVAALLLA